MADSERARALYDEGLDAFRAGDAERSRELNEESLREARDAGDRVGVVRALIGLTRLAFRAGDLDEGRRLAWEAERLANEAGDDEGALMALHMQAEMLRAERHYDEAVPLYEQIIEAHRASGNERRIAVELYNCGAVLALNGDGERAAGLLREGLERASKAGDEGLTLYCLLGMAEAAAVSDRARDAARLLTVAKKGFERRGEVLDPAEAAEVHVTEAAIAARLSPEQLDAARAEGAAMSLGEATALALSE